MRAYYKNTSKSKYSNKPDCNVLKLSIVKYYYTLLIYKCFISATARFRFIKLEASLFIAQTLKNEGKKVFSVRTIRPFIVPFSHRENIV